MHRFHIWLVGLMLGWAAPLAPAASPTPNYWDRLGWKDRFSSAAYTNRQQVYGARFGNGNIYTPQMVVDGVSGFVGSDASAAQRAGSTSLAAPHGSLSINVEEVARRRASSEHGRTLWHTAVVREMLPIGEVTSQESSTARGEVPPAADWQRDAINLVAFVQERRGRQVLASAAVRLKNARP
jgi:hypothetical protein